MPLWGRPPGARAARMGRSDLRGGVPYGSNRFQELGDSDEDEYYGLHPATRGVFLDPMMQKGAVMGQASLSDEYLLGKGINSRPRFAEDRLTYEEDYYQDDYHGRGAGREHYLDPDEEKYLFQRALDRVRVARARGQPDVSLTHEELEILTRPRSRQLPALADPSSARPSSEGLSSRSKKASRAPLLAPDSRQTNQRHNPDFSPSDSSSSSPGPPGFVIPGGGAAPLGYATGSSRANYRSISDQSQGVRTRSKESQFTPSPPNSHDRNRNVPGSPAYGIPGAFADESNYRPESRASSYNSSHHSSTGPDFAESDDYPHPRLPPRQLHPSTPPYPVHPSERPSPMPLDPFAYQTGGPTYPYPSAAGVAYARVPRRVPVGRREDASYASNAAGSFSDSSLVHGGAPGDGSARMYGYGGPAYTGRRGADRDYDEVQVQYDEGGDVDEPAGRSGSGSSVEREREKERERHKQAAAAASASASGRDKTTKEASSGARERSGSGKSGKKKARRK
ncbi:uncharacterized protein BKA78DRAFT_350183 [Phyllosticta capitalensis]|uniref:Uncharacterized protein n=1 Tax=Phyllosticta capitalensis TaxID=121624 RepID=A0ABR1YZY4_9PEZI